MQPNHRLKHHFSIIFLIALAVTITVIAILYYPTLGYYFIHEDADFVCAINEPGAIYHSDLWGFRLLGDLMRWDYFLSGRNPMGYHIFNLMAHFIVCILLYILCQRLKLGKIPSLFAVLAFSIHPWVFGTVGWISGRLDIDEAAWIIATLLAYDKYLSADAPNKGKWFGASLFFYLAALLSKETAYIVPFLLIPWEFVIFGRVRWKKSLLSLGIFAAIILSLLGLRLIIGASMGVYGDAHGKFGFFQLENLWHYLTLLLTNDLLGVMNPIITMLGVGFVILTTLLDRRALFVTLLLLLPIVIVSNLTVQTWYLYIPAAALAILMAVFLERTLSVPIKSIAIKVFEVGLCLTVLFGGYTYIHLPRTLQIRQSNEIGSRFLADLIKQFSKPENRPPRPTSLIILEGLPENIAGYALYSDEIGFDIDLVVNNNVKHGTKYLMDTSHTMVFTPQEMQDYRDQIESFPLPVLFYELKLGQLIRLKEQEARYVLKRMDRDPENYLSETFFSPRISFTGSDGLVVIQEQGFLVLSGSGVLSIGNLERDQKYGIVFKIRSDAPANFTSSLRRLSLPGDDSYTQRLFAANADDKGIINIQVDGAGRIEIDDMTYGPIPTYFPPP